MDETLFGPSIERSAIFSPCGLYRYTLTRAWGPGPRLAFVMLNPSTAGAVLNDPTVERCERRARASGFDGLEVRNLFAIRATDPIEMRAAEDPIGPDNDGHLNEVASCGSVIAAWGTHGGHLRRAERVAARLRGLGVQLLCLGENRDGSPKHPLYVAASVKPARWSRG